MLNAFDLVVRSAAGELRTLRLSASDADSARALAARDGAQVLSCAARAAAAPKARRSMSVRGQRLDVTTFSQELSSLLAAGLPVVDALRTLAANASAGATRSLLLAVVDGVCTGQALSAALAAHGNRFPALLIATVRASEQTGDISTALGRYAEHQASMRGLRDKVVGASVYPAVLMVVGSLVVLFLLGVVVPKFATLIESTHRELPWSSQMLMSWGRAVAAHPARVGIAALAVFCGAAFTVQRVWRSGGRARWVEALPIVGPTLRMFRHAQLYRTTGMLVRGGIAAPRALELSIGLLGDDDRERLRHAVRLVHEGRSLSSALEETQLADPVARGMLSVGERTGALPDLLERIAAFHEVRLQRSVELASRLFEPALMIVIGLVIGAIVVLMYLPIFDLASSLQ